MAFWKQEIATAVRESDLVRANHLITRCHYHLAGALGQVLGSDAGANFHSWAVWGSRKAGVTIRQEDKDDAQRDGTLVGGLVGALVGLAIGTLGLRPWLPAGLAWGGATLLGALCGGLTGRLIIARSRRVSARLVLAGNRTVLEDIGMQSAHFITRFHQQTTPDARALADFLAELRPGESTHGGQELLRQAFTNYYHARFAPDQAARQQAAYLANCLAVYHEHVRLEPYIRGAMPLIIRRCVTQRLLQFDIGPVKLAVAHDVPTLNSFAFPPSLLTLPDPAARHFLMTVCATLSDAPPLAHTAARDWTKIGERMRYIATLFRALHLDAAVMSTPLELVA